MLEERQSLVANSLVGRVWPRPPNTTLRRQYEGFHASVERGKRHGVRERDSERKRDRTVKRGEGGGAVEKREGRDSELWKEIRIEKGIERQRKQIDGGESEREMGRGLQKEKERGMKSEK